MHIVFVHSCSTVIWNRNTEQQSHKLMTTSSVKTVRIVCLAVLIYLMSQLLIYPFISLSIDIVRWLKKSEREWLYFWNLWVWNDLAKSYFEFCVKVVTHKLALEQHPSGVNSTLQCLWNRIPVPPTTLPPSQIQLATWHSQAAANTAGSVGRSMEFMVVFGKRQMWAR